MIIRRSRTSHLPDEEELLPRITLLDATGTAYRIDTAAYPLVQTWLYYWAPRLPKPLMMMVRPLRDGGEADWPCEPQHYRSYRERFQVANDPEIIMEQLHRRRAELETPG
jgi:hypothetical protein